MSTSVKAKPVRGRYRTIAIVVVVVVVGLVFWQGWRGRDEDPSAEMPSFVVKRGPLTINVLESGTIKAREQVIIKNEVEGRTSIISLIPEGTRVKAGDLLVELDSSSLLDSKIDQEIRVQNAEASFINATEKLAVAENQAKSDIDKAELTLEFANQDLKKYIEGEYPNELKEAEAKITLAQEELTRVQETLTWSKTLYQEKYISQTELQADELAEKKRILDLELARNNIDLLKNFTYERNMAQLHSDVSQADMALERTRRKATADVVQAEAELKAREAEYKRQQDKLTKIEEQIDKTRIFAPADGLVIYATSARSGGGHSNVEPLDEGQEVRERQELIYLPTASSAKVEVSIHETSLEKVRLGLPAVVTVDALPGKRFWGSVARIAPLPDAQSMWMNPDLKVYNTDIYLDDNDDSLRTGMSCKVEIIVGQYEDALYVPMQAVLRVAGKPTVYVMAGKEMKPRQVDTGLDNNRMIHILSGLEEGERVVLTPPLKAAGIDSPTVGVERDGAEDSAASEVREEIAKKLEAANGGKAAHGDGPDARDNGTPGRELMKSASEDAAEGVAGGDSAPGGAFGQMSQEDMKKMRQRFESLSPEEQEKLKKQFGNRPPGQSGRGRRPSAEGSP